VVLIEPDVHRDDRGFFLETWHAAKYAERGIDVRFVQDNHSRSQRNTLRGLHAQLVKPQGKLLRVTAGEIWDVAVDIRPDSPHFGRWVAAKLSDENFHMLWIPPGFAHGFCVLSERADVEYKCTVHYDPADEIAIRWNDPAIGVTWPGANPILSARDRNAPTLAELRPRLQSAAETVRSGGNP
jgi:dTDP-4-dehydrorhamnose 3,5-epimerase